jgi:TonB-linked SusC/RagA family outer membrane protein
MQVLAQTITLSGSKLSFDDLSSAIKKQTGHLLFSKKGELMDLPALSVSNMPLREFMDLLVKDRPLQYSISDKTIVLSPKPPGQAVRDTDQQAKVTVKFTVTDADGQALPGATVVAKKSKASGLTAADGTLNLTVLENDAIVVSFIGFETQTLQLDKATVKNGMVSIVLAPSESRLNEVTVVSTGYQTIERTRATGAITTIGSQELEKRNAVNIMENLEGKVPGLVQYRGNATIRGTSSLPLYGASTDILVVVDGFPIQGSIADINPYDVESISVLKDAAAAAIYGARASNGVIVVTTKKARERGRTTVEISGNITLTDKADYSYQNYMTPAQQVGWESEYYNWWYNGGSGQPLATQLSAFEANLNAGYPYTPVEYAYYQLKKGQITQVQLDATLNELKKNDFAGQFREHALLNQVLQQYNLALRTNNGRSQSSLVINYTTDNGGIINAYNRRLNLFYKGTYSPSKWLDIDYGINSVIGKARSHSNAAATSPFNVPSYYRLLNPDGTRAFYTNMDFNPYSTIRDSIPLLYSFGFNHLDELEHDFTNTSSMNTRYYVILNFKVLKGLTINPMFQYEDNRTSSSSYSEPESYTMRRLHNTLTTAIRDNNGKLIRYERILPEGGKLATSERFSPNYTARAQANYDRAYGLHRFLGMAGFELRQTRSYGRSGVLLGYNDQEQTQLTNNIDFGVLGQQVGTLWSPNVGPGSFSNFGLIRDEMHRFASAYANLTYTYDGKYNLFGSARKDYADLFGGDEKYRGRPLWSVGASWIASNEGFLKEFQSISHLKFRATYGFTGNILPTTARLAATTGTNVTQQVINATVPTPPNPQLRWEKTATTNIGIDFGLLQNRLRGTFDYYRKLGTDLFARKRLDPMLGYTALVINNASMRNNGIELSVGYDWFRPAKQGGVRWSTNVIASWNKNRITEVDTLNPTPDQIAAGGAYRLGYPVNAIFSFQYAGLNDQGVPQFYNLKGEKTIATLSTAERGALVYSGESVPTRTFSLNNDLSFKGFTLSIFAVYYGGHYFRTQPHVGIYNLQYAPMPAYLLDSWTPTNTDTDVSGSTRYFIATGNSHYNYADIFVRPADFIKIRNIVFGYDIPGNIASRISASNLRVRVQLNNPKAIWTRQTDVHVDPETGGAPIPASFVLGINTNF